MRIERDLLGEMPVPKEAYYGIRTARTLENFRLAGRPFPPLLIKAAARVKRACAEVNAALGFLEERVAKALVLACEEMAGGGLWRHVVVDALSGGAGAPLNTNVTEVLANRAEEILGGRLGAGELVDAERHANLHQSGHEIFAVALRLAALDELAALEPVARDLELALKRKELDFAEVVRLGRCLQGESAPLTLGMSFSAWAEAVGRDLKRLSACRERLWIVGLGCSPLAGGAMAPPGFSQAVVEALRESTGHPLSRARNLVDACQNQDGLVEVSAALRGHAVNLFKISSDLRLLATGPLTGLGEITLPAVLPAAQALPGRVSPVICEAVAQAALRAMAEDASLTQAAALGQLESNVFAPLLAQGLLRSLELLRRADAMFVSRCIKGIKADEARCLAQVHASSSVLAALVPLIGYEQTSLVAAYMREHDCGLTQAFRALGAPREALEKALTATSLTRLGHC